MTEPASPQRRPVRRRFERNPEPPRIELQERDLDIVRAAARFRFINTEQVMRLTGASQRVAQRTLTRLYDHRLLDRPPAQKKRLLVGRNEALVYALGREGAKLLADPDGRTTRHIDWSLKNSRAGALFIEHTLGVADVMIGFHLAAAERGIPIVDSHDLIPHLPEPTRKLANPFAWHVDVRVPGEKPKRLGVIPDRVFSLVLPDRAVHFCLEFDTGEMPVERKSLSSGSSIARKMHVYWQGYLDGLHKKQWGFAGFRVLIVTTSEARIATMLETLNRITHGKAPGMFLFAVADEVRGTNPSALPWKTVGGSCVPWG